jgi:hypothetical protein
MQSGHDVGWPSGVRDEMVISSTEDVLDLTNY